ncbi:MAG: dihydroorotase [Bacteroidales bacterium]|jgi:dihydroorotase|nr:dihydroorotase [Bacteroidales bacterium]MDD4214899.1 dihydroorotase [Bacteroidales bacterium]
MKKNYLIKNATIINEGKTFSGDVLIIGNFIADIGENIPISVLFAREQNIEVIDASEMFLIPGVIDDQVHFREPGLTRKGDIASESAAAVAGGVTSFMDMPNTKPPALTLELLEQKYEIAEKTSQANFSFYLGASNDNIEHLKQFDPTKNCGIKVFLGSSTGNMLVDNTETIKKIFSLPFLIAIHSEDEATIRANTEFYRQKYGEDVPVKFHAAIRSAEACFKSSQRAVMLAHELGTRLHILHLSTADELAFLTNNIPLEEKKITSEVCVHHLWFNEDAYHTKGTLIKWNPSIKTEADRKALFKAVLDGTIDVVATDHAPHTFEEKMQTYFSAPSGGPLVQHSLLMMLEFSHQKQLSLEEIPKLMCHHPAICFKVQKRGFIRKNYYADLVLLDLKTSTSVITESLLYKCKWSPLEGTTFSSKITATFVNGYKVYDGVNVAEKTHGMRLTFN